MSYIENVKRVCADRPEIIKAFEEIDRRQFLPRAYRKYADHDMPLPIGYGQTTSQPSLIADMICRADIKRGDKVLEIGTGTGFAASIMATLGADVYTVEKIPELYQLAKENLSSFDNVHVFLAGDVLGLPEYAPFDKILVFAHAEDIPIELLDQLKEGGIMIVPVGDERIQYLMKIEKTFEGDKVETLYPVRFVPLR
ncbi:protein-L-isoaspartate(D-aspartate) O-methyltransferase [bacterium 3DAC]|nr:protein-L-isoaspartate(D-aspartate) O-methyltransferase [Dictyoglomota bacterium]UZN23281.1 protein-L-isoaspartate(D-aspartate) O-methyltransferase [bacterium 3DAC]